MRVLVNRQGDSGAVAVVVALLSVVLFGLSAFAVDFGLAYNSKRNLQKAADAAALSAATEIIRQSKPSASCAELVNQYDANANSLADKVGSVADQYATANRNDATRELLDVRCSLDGKRLEVAYVAAGVTPTLFGGVLGHSGDYEQSRSAVADLFVPPGATGLRPYFVCDTDLERLKQAAALGGSSAVVQIRYEKDSGPCGTFPGNWYAANCPLFSNQGQLDEFTLYGCAEEVKIIEPLPNSTAVTQAQVEEECSPSLQSKVPTGCMVSNPGNLVAGGDNTQLIGAWNTLLTLPGIAIPIFNEQWKTWADARNTVDCKFQGQGSNGCYPIEAIAGVKVCGYKFNNKDGLDPENALPNSPCTGVAAQLAALAPNDQANYLWLRLVNVQTTGSTKPSSCGLGESCDGGLRRTRLVE
jgi:hypothetical protein